MVDGSVGEDIMWDQQLAVTLVHPRRGHRGSPCTLGAVSDGVPSETAPDEGLVKWWMIILQAGVNRTLTLE